ncbi:SpoIIE family protein phosphatase [Nocardioides sp. SOB72]|uniref:SpoIIE family protein phosphatase n=1 Tax=Nocardioides abyssi TaxID=3058370 RepID=A0ABT8EQZ4_9ACTN|nr:SpoIIE family protein phosphatase [Nocardioides abyssi]MDN4160564.1 SpoIIE family protein phosphatase [Nocardioides abyssi]
MTTGQGARDDAERLLDQAPCGFLTTAPDGTVLRVNATFLRWTGRPVEAVVGRRLVDLLTPGGRIFHETHYAPMLRMQGSVHEIAVDLRCGDGSRLSVLLNATLSRDEHGAEREVLVAVFDATERRRYERQLLRAHDEARGAEARAMTLARTLQQTLVPPVPPRVRGLTLAATYRPSGDGSQVGGDFYDVFPTGPDEQVVVLGDVSGKGVDAAVVTSLVRNTVRALAVLHHRPSSLLAELNDIVGTHETERFCTAVVLRMRREPDGAWRVVVAAGGHPPPLLLRPDEPAVEVDVHGPLVGILPDQEYGETELRLAPREVLVLYTDGVTEARRDGELFGEVRLHATLDRVGARDVPGLVAELEEEVVAFQSGVTGDDIAIVAVSPTPDPDPDADLGPDPETG